MVLCLRLSPLNEVTENRPLSPSSVTGEVSQKALSSLTPLLTRNIASFIIENKVFACLRRQEAPAAIPAVHTSFMPHIQAAFTACTVYT